MKYFFSFFFFYTSTWWGGGGGGAQGGEKEREIEGILSNLPNDFSSGRKGEAGWRDGGEGEGDGILCNLPNDFSRGWKGEAGWRDGGRERERAFYAACQTVSLLTAVLFNPFWVSTTSLSFKQHSALFPSLWLLTDTILTAFAHDGDYFTMTLLSKVYISNWKGHCNSGVQAMADGKEILPILSSKHD